MTDQEISFEEIEKLTKLHKHDIPDDDWINLFEMIENIREHAKRCPI